MYISKLYIENFRIIQSALLEPSKEINLIHGCNGSGKTSLLESIFYLSTGKSFRQSSHNQIITHESSKLLLRSHFTDDTNNSHILGISRQRDGLFEAKLDGDKLNSLSKITKSFPVKIIQPDMHSLISGSPTNRRKFIDWGLFYLDEKYQDEWKRYSFALKQRNALLKNSYSDNELKTWTNEVSISGEIISDQRNQYIKRLLPYINSWLQYFTINIDISIDFKQGWDVNIGLLEALNLSKKRCQFYKSTSIGPHRADLIINSNNILAKSYVSRGQQKLVVISLIFAQISLLKETQNESLILLLDDPLAELDSHHCELLTNALSEFKTQVFVTTNEVSRYNQLSNINLIHFTNGKLS